MRGSKGSQGAGIIHAKFQCKQHYPRSFLNNWKALHPVKPGGGAATQSAFFPLPLSTRVYVFPGARLPGAQARHLGDGVVSNFDVVHISAVTTGAEDG